ncbi:MAG: hypothetical protein KDD92_19530 [Caldilineaceae bacterium]|nr:hypothetical protein [Caldilineaceae bacterium]
MGAFSVHVLESTTYLTKIYEENPHELESPPPHFLRNRSRYLYLIAIVLALTTLLAPAPIYSQTDDGNVPDDDPAMQHKGDPAWDVVAAYAQGLNISYDEAQRRFTVQHQFSLLKGELYERELAYGGGWIEHKPEFRLGLHFSAPNGEDILRKYTEKYALGNEIRIVQSPYSLKELEAISLMLFENKELQDRFSFSTSINTRSAAIVVRAEEPEMLATTLRADIDFLGNIAAVVNEKTPNRLLDFMRFEYGESPVPLTVDYPYYRGGGDINGCTAGLALTNLWTGKNYASTAAHCVPTEENPLSIDGFSLGDTFTIAGPYSPAYSDIRVLDAEDTDLENPWIITNRIRGMTNPPMLMEYITGYYFRSQLGNGDILAHRGNYSQFAVIEVEDTYVNTTTRL